ncbi:MAG TPA: MFS transporter, partial [Candidatus Methanomethylicus sp.]|nr:MFS transporter [Candidatus Methanomethylicus sp.]
MSDNSLKRTTLLVTSLANFLFPFNVFSMNIAIPTIGKELQMDAFTLGWVSTGFLLASAIFLIPFGKISDIHGRKRIFNYGLLLFSLVSIPLALSNSAGMLILLRAVQGIGGAMYLGTLMAILTGVYPLRERGIAMGINTMAVSIGITSGPFLGGLLTQYVGWRSIFLVNVPLGLLILALTLWKIKMEWCEAKGDRLDVVGSLVYGVLFIAVMYGITLLPSVEGLACIAIGMVILPVFIKLERSVKTPIINLDLFSQSNRPFIFSNLAALIYYSATFAINYTLSLYLQYSKGFAPTDAGTIILTQSVLTVIFAPIAGRLTDKYGARLVATIGMAVTALGTGLLIFIDGGIVLEFLLINLGLLGVGAGFFNGPNQYAIMSSVEKKFLGVASGMLGTMRQIGQVLSMGIATIVLTLTVGRGQITPDLYPLFNASARIIFVI